MADISASLHVRLIFLQNATGLVFFCFCRNFLFIFFLLFACYTFSCRIFHFPRLVPGILEKRAQNCDDDKNSCLNFVSFLYKFTARFQAFIYRDVLNVYAQLKFNLVFFLPSQRI